MVQWCMAICEIGVIRVAIASCHGAGLDQLHEAIEERLLRVTYPPPGLAEREKLGPIDLEARAPGRTSSPTRPAKQWTVFRWPIAVTLPKSTSVTGAVTPVSSTVSRRATDPEPLVEVEAALAVVKEFEPTPRELERLAGCGGVGVPCHRRYFISRRTDRTKASSPATGQ